MSPARVSAATSSADPSAVSERAELWDGRYTTTGPTRVSWFSPDMHVSVELLQRAGLTPRTSVVDVGGGASVLVDRLLDTGLTDVTVVDISVAALSVAQQRLRQGAADVDWVQADVLRWSPGRTWDLWHDRAVFHFLTQPEDVAVYVALAATSLVAGGHLVVGTFAPDGPTTCSGLPVTRATPAELAEVFAPHFELEHDALESHLTPSGTTQSFSWAVLRRRSPAEPTPLRT